MNKNQERELAILTNSQFGELFLKKVLDMGTDWEYTYAAWMTDMRISQESISDQLFKKGDAIMGRGLNLYPRTR